MPGPERAASSSVASPISAAVGMIPSAAVTKISVGEACGELERDRDRDERDEQVGPALGAEQESQRGSSGCGAHGRRKPSGGPMPGRDRRAGTRLRRVRTRRFGDTDLEASEIGFGTWALGSNWWGDVSESDGERLLARGARARDHLLRHRRRLRPRRQRGARRACARPAPRRGRDRDQVRLRAARGQPRALRGRAPAALGRRLRPRAARGEPETARHRPRRPLPAPQPAHGRVESDETFAALEDAQGRGQAPPLRRRARPGDRMARGGPARDRDARDHARCRPSTTCSSRSPGASCMAAADRARRRRDGAGADLERAARRQPDARDDASARPTTAATGPASGSSRGCRRSSGSASCASRRQRAHDGPGRAALHPRQRDHDRDPDDHERAPSCASTRRPPTCPS